MFLDVNCGQFVTHLFASRHLHRHRVLQIYIENGFDPQNLELTEHTDIEELQVLWWEQI
jgi:hypothetical protein